jgi:hypothetical protein
MGNEKLKDEKDLEFKRIVEIFKQADTKVLLANLFLSDNNYDVNDKDNSPNDVNYFTSELIAVLAMNFGFFNEEEDAVVDLQELIDLSVSYHTKTVLISQLSTTKTSLSKIVSQFENVRFPSYPHHQFEFYAGLYCKYGEVLKKHFGFSHEESIFLRKELPLFIAYLGNRLKDVIIVTDSKNNAGEQPIEKENDFIERLGEVLFFKPKQFAEYVGYDEKTVNTFLEFHCCLISDEKHSGVIEIDKSKSQLRETPILKYKNDFFVTSVAMLPWATELKLQRLINEDKILEFKDSFHLHKHDYTLSVAIDKFRDIFPDWQYLGNNLKYHYKGKQRETDALFLYDNILFVVESKGHTITDKAKRGNIVRLKKHLKHILIDAYDQGLTCLEYIMTRRNAEFYKGSEKVVIDQCQFSDFVVVPLSYENLGYLSTEMNLEKNFYDFSNKPFPFFVGIMDLYVFSDLIDNPLLFLSYIKKRKQFMKSDKIHTYEEIDLFDLYLTNRLPIDKMVVDKKSDDYLYLMPDSYFENKLNNYYWSMLGVLHEEIQKPKVFDDDSINVFFDALESSKIYCRSMLGMALLEFSDETLKKVIGEILGLKRKFVTENKDLVFSFGNEGLKVGFSYMIANNSKNLKEMHLAYCLEQKSAMNVSVWIGLCDVSSDVKSFEFYDLRILPDSENKLNNAIMFI